MSYEDKYLILDVIKSNVGLSTTTVRDEYILQIIDGEVARLAKKGAPPTGTGEYYQDEYRMLVADLAKWNYETGGGIGELPVNLAKRERNLILGDKDV